MKVSNFVVLCRALRNNTDAEDVVLKTTFIDFLNRIKIKGKEIRNETKPPINDLNQIKKDEMKPPMSL